ncbi:MAG: lipid-A-disaccharide synthase [Desulfovibrionaceae bacterium]|nr:lipid-A-disaccharide synthase [Desulfovibrionaceae bacterium]
MRTLWINAGELSGDVQAGALLSALTRLAPGLRVVGMGGDNLAAAGQENLFRVEELSVMGVVEVLTSLPRILRLLRRIKASLAALRPDAVLLVDAPDFNFRVARMAHALGIPVYYFIPPKLWAWRSGRVRFLRRHVRRVFSILPFEVDFYKRHHMDVRYVGNPLVDLVNRAAMDAIRPVAGRIGLMPGSRRKEVESLLPAFSGAADLALARFPRLEFHCIRAPHFSEEYLRSFWSSAAPLHFQPAEGRYAFMRSCQCIMAASGTATLESGLTGTPTLVAYKVHPVSAFIGRRVLNVPWISLTNLILNREAFPEHIQAEAAPGPLARRLIHWLDNPAALNAMQRDLDELRILCGPPGSAERAARAVLEVLE